MTVNNKGKQYILCSCFWITVTGMTHGTEARYKKIITSVIGWCVFFNICKFDKLKEINKMYYHLSENVKQSSFIICYTDKKYSNKKKIKYEIS